MAVTIRLENLHIDFADKLAVRRQDAADRRRRPAKNGAPTSRPRALAMHVLGTRTEAAGKLYLNPIAWNAFVEDVRDVPDLGDFIDVKGRSKSWHNLIVQEDDPANWAYLLVDASKHPIYSVIGWCWGHEAKQKKFWNDPAGGRAAYFVDDRRILRPPTDLFAIVHA